MLQATDLEKLQDVLEYRFQNKELLFRALVHRSFAYENQDVAADNETLEFLGDSVLGFGNKPSAARAFSWIFHQGELSRLRSSIVNERELAQIASSIDLGDYLLLGKGEELLRRTAETFTFGRTGSSVSCRRVSGRGARIRRSGWFKRCFTAISNTGKRTTC